MANFNIGIDCPDEIVAKKLHKFIERIELYQDGLDVYEDRVSLISKQGLLPEIKKFEARLKKRSPESPRPTSSTGPIKKRIRNLMSSDEDDYN